MLAKRFLPNLVRSRCFSMSMDQLQCIQDKVNDSKKMALHNRELIIFNHPFYKKLMFNEIIEKANDDIVDYVTIDDNIKDTISKVATNINILENFEMDNRLRIMDIDRRDIELLAFRISRKEFNDDLLSHETLNKRLDDLCDYSNASREAIVERRTISSKITDWITLNVYGIDNTKVNL